MREEDLGDWKKKREGEIGVREKGKNNVYTGKETHVVYYCACICAYFCEHIKSRNARKFTLTKKHALQ